MINDCDCLIDRAFNYKFKNVSIFCIGILEEKIALALILGLLAKKFCLCS